MALTTIPAAAITAIASTPGANVHYNDTANSTKQTVKAASTVVYQVRVDNSLNGVAVYVKLWNLLAASVTVGTTDPDEIIFVPANQIINVKVNGEVGKTFATGVVEACVTTGGTGGTTSPTSAVPIEISYT